MERRDFLKLGGTAIAAGATVMRSTARRRRAGRCPGAVCRAEDRDGPHRLRRHRRSGSGHVRNLLKVPGCRITAVCDIRAERTDWATEADHRGGPARASGVQPRPARFRTAVRDRRSGSGLHRDAMGMARADHAVGHEERQARRDGSAGGDDARGLLGAGGVRGEATRSTAS